MKNKSSQVHRNNGVVRERFNLSPKKHSSQQNKRITSPQSQQRSSKSIPSALPLPVTVNHFPLTRVAVSGEKIHDIAHMTRRDLDEFSVEHVLNQTEVKSVLQPTRQLKNSKKKKRFPHPLITSLRVTSHPDDVFLSGAWLFDLSIAPKWFTNALAASTQKYRKQTARSITTVRPKKLQALPISQLKVKSYHEDDVVYSGAWLFIPLNQCPRWFQQALTCEKRKKAQRKKRQVAAPPIQQLHFSALHPDDGFTSGAWLFDNSVAPSWLQSCLASVASNKKQRNLNSISSGSIDVKQVKSNVAPIQQLHVRIQDPNVVIESGAWLFDISAAPVWFQNLVPKPAVARRLSGFSCHTRTQTSLEQVVYLKPCPMQRLNVVADENVGFYSGAWLFDSDCMPEWFGNEFSLIPSKRSNQELVDELYPPKRQRQLKLGAVGDRKSASDDFNNPYLLFDPNGAPHWLHRALPSYLISSIVGDTPHPFHAYQPRSNFYQSPKFAPHAYPPFLYQSVAPSPNPYKKFTPFKFASCPPIQPMNGRTQPSVSRFGPGI